MTQSTDRTPRHAVFELSGVSLRRDGRPILEGIDLTIRDGERWVVLGPNGAGKTTLVRILSTYLIASSGHVEVLGHLLSLEDRIAAYEAGHPPRVDTLPR